MCAIDTIGSAGKKLYSVYMLVSRCFPIICVVFSPYKHYLYGVKCDTNIKKHNVIIEEEKYLFCIY